MSTDNGEFFIASNLYRSSGLYQAIAGRSKKAMILIKAMNSKNAFLSVSICAKMKKAHPNHLSKHILAQRGAARTPCMANHNRRIIEKCVDKRQNV
jgi:hypothetical protein